MNGKKFQKLRVRPVDLPAEQSYEFLGNDSVLTDLQQPSAPFPPTSRTFRGVWGSLGPQECGGTGGSPPIPLQSYGEKFPASAIPHASRNRSNDLIHHWLRRIRRKRQPQRKLQQRQIHHIFRLIHNN